MQKEIKKNRNEALGDIVDLAHLIENAKELSITPLAPVVESDAMQVLLSDAISKGLALGNSGELLRCTNSLKDALHWYERHIIVTKGL